MAKINLNEELSRVQAELQKAQIQEALLIEKASKSSNPEYVLRAQREINSKSQNIRKGKSYFFDPLNVNDGLGFKEKPYQLSYNILRSMSKTHLVKSIITTRKEQVSNFSSFVDDPQKVGWTIKKKRRLFEKEAELSYIEKVEIEGIVNFINNCGSNKVKWFGDSFDTFLKKTTVDSLVLDQKTFEVVRTRSGHLHEFFATDGGTYRLASSFNNELINNNQIEIDGYYPSHVQIYQGIIKNEFYPWELCFGIRNHDTDIAKNGYGTSELENLIKSITWLLYSEQYNGKFFSEGSSPKGMIKIKGDIGPDKLSAFRQQWQSQVKGIENAWKTPIVQADELDWIDLQKTNQDMQFDKWMEFLIRIICAHYTIDPQEVNFNIGGGQVNYDSSLKDRLAFSKFKGLYPLLKSQEKDINKYIVGPLGDNKYEFVFTGLDIDPNDMSLENDIKKLTNGIITWKEIRRKYNYPMEIEEDDFLLNSIWLSIKSQESQQQQQMMQQGGGQPFSSSEGNNWDGDINSLFKPNPYEAATESKSNPFEEGLGSFLDKMGNEE